MTDLGLTPWDACVAWGTASAKTQGYWSAARTDSLYNKGVCCQ